MIRCDHLRPMWRLRQTEMTAGQTLFCTYRLLRHLRRYIRRTQTPSSAYRAYSGQCITTSSDCPRHDNVIFQAPTPLSRLPRVALCHFSSMPSSEIVFISSFQESANAMARRPSSVRLSVCKVLRKSLLLADNWPDRHQTCTRWSPGKHASRVCSRSTSRSKVTFLDSWNELLRH